MLFLVVAPYFIILLPKTQYTTVDKEPEKLNFYGKNKGSIIFVVGKSPIDIMEPILL